MLQPGLHYGRMHQIAAAVKGRVGVRAALADAAAMCVYAGEAGTACMEGVLGLGCFPHDGAADHSGAQQAGRVASRECNGAAAADAAAGGGRAFAAVAGATGAFVPAASATAAPSAAAQSGEQAVHDKAVQDSEASECEAVKGRARQNGHGFQLAGGVS